MQKAFKHNIISILSATALFVVVLAFGAHTASAQYQYNGGYSYGSGYNNYGGGYNGGYGYGGGYSYSGGYSYYPTGYNTVYNGGNYYPTYPSPRTIPTTQVVYPNGYFYNYYQPTVTYFPAGYGNGYNYGGYGGGGYNGGYGGNNRRTPCTTYNPCM